MTAIGSYFILLGLLGCSLFFRFAILVWTSLFGFVLVFLSFKRDLSGLSLTLLWIFYLIALGFVVLSPLRKRYLTAPLLRILKKRMPSISQTEREAIEAGNTWWEKELFVGQPHWRTLLNYPKPELSQEEEDFLANQTEILCSMLNDWEIVHRDHNLSQEVWEYLKKEKFFAMAIPKTYGGLGFSALGHSTVIIKIATRSISAAVNTMVPNSLGPAELLVHYGTQEQKSYYLPRLANGEEIPCFALTAPEAGSDASAIPDKGIVCRDIYQGVYTLGIRLSWDKRYITLAPIATVLGLAFHLYDPEHLLGDQEERGITLCLIPTSHPGVDIGTRHLPLHLSFMNGPTRGENVFIPLDWVIGGPEMVGQGWRMLMECLSIGRSISLPALATACGKLTYRYTGAYAKLRRQFNVPIAQFEGIEEALSQIAGFTYLLEATRIMTAGAVDQKVKPSLASAIAKYHMTELARQVINHAMDIHAGHMIQVGPRNFLANVYIAVPISITVEGANILTRNLIVFGQGAIRCHPYLLQEVTCITTEETRDSLNQLDRLLLSHMGFFLSNIIRNSWYGITGGKAILVFAPIKHAKVKKYYRQLTRMSAALALLADMSLMALGGSLKRRERVSARLGDILSQLYLASAVLKYFHDQREPDEDVDYVLWCVKQCLYKIQIACDELLANYPYRWLGKIMRGILFPWGAAFRKPSDALDQKIVSSMLTVSPLRERLIKYSYVAKDEQELTYQLEKAFALSKEAEPLLKKMRQATNDGLVKKNQELSEKIEVLRRKNILTIQEAQILQEFEALRKEIIKVNEFSFNLDTIVA